MSEERDRVSVLIVDDEPLARDAIRLVLAQLPDVVLAGEAATAAEAVETIATASPDIVLLDVRMPDGDGFDVIESVGAAKPAIIFVTAFDAHAIRAFEVHAIDYVLKPFDDARIIDAIGRAQRWLDTGRSGDDDRRFDRLATRLRTEVGRPFAERIMVRDQDRIRFERVDRIDWFEAANNNVVIHVGEHEYRIRSTLKSLQSRLDPARFVRIHRSTIVNLDRVREVQPWFGGDYVAILADGRKLKVSRTFRDALLRPLH
jgi:two-component system LytT family response regulator